MFLELKLQSENKYRINNSGAIGISQAHTVSGDRLFVFILYWSQDLLISLADWFVAIQPGGGSERVSSSSALSQALAMMNAASQPPTLINMTSSEREREITTTHATPSFFLCCCGIWADPAVTSHLHTHTQEIQTSVPVMDVRFFCICWF